MAEVNLTNKAHWERRKLQELSAFQGLPWLFLDTEEGRRYHPKLHRLLHTDGMMDKEYRALFGGNYPVSEEIIKRECAEAKRCLQRV